MAYYGWGRQLVRMTLWPSSKQMKGYGFMTDFTVQEGDVTEVPSDLLILKYAQGFYGADKAVASRLTATDVYTLSDIQPSPGKAIILETKGIIAPARVLFMGTPPLSLFTYDEMELFAYRAIVKIAELELTVRMITTTVHGTGYGLDGGEALQRLVQGFKKGLARSGFSGIQRITFLTLGRRACRMLATILDNMDNRDVSVDKPQYNLKLTLQEPCEGMAKPQIHLSERVAAEISSSNPIVTENKKHIFVAMPFSEDFENVYEFGIYPAIRDCGFICERTDHSHWFGDTLDRIKVGIESASLVVADLTENRPNVYLEVGYAWGKGVPVIFLAKKGEILPFDVSTHRCIFYGSFTKLKKDLEDLIGGISNSKFR